MILDAAFLWAAANGSKTGECWCFFAWHDRGFRVRVENVARVHAPVLADVMFDSMEEALDYFTVAKQLTLFEVNNG